MQIAFVDRVPRFTYYACRQDDLFSSIDLISDTTTVYDNTGCLFFSVKEYFFSDSVLVDR